MSTQINGQTCLCGVVGDPIAHTLSPFIHNALAEAMNVNTVYVPLHVTEEHLEEAIVGAHGMHMRGMNVTVPHKQQVMQYLSEIHEGANAIGAVNTLVRRPDGYHGYNTDWMGLERALKDHEISLCGKTVVLLGAGGAAHAAAYLCGRQAAEKVLILNRTPQKAIQLAEKMHGLFPGTEYCGAQIDHWKQLAGDGYICIQTTSQGMVPNEDQAVIEEQAFYHKISAAVDIVYNPGMTKFMKLGKAAGAMVCNGLLMLLYQAVSAFELMHEVTVPKEAIQKIKKELEEQFAYGA